MSDLAVHLGSLVTVARSRRYPTVLVGITQPSQIPDGILAEVGHACCLKVVDFREQVLTHESSVIILGAYSRGQFITWLIGEARSAGGILVHRADEVIAAWPEPERKAFFMEFLRTECNDSEDRNRRVPIMLVSLHVQHFSLPNANRGQGIFHLLSDADKGELK